MQATEAVALVAGGTRGAGRGIAVELGAAGMTVYVTGRSTREAPSDLGRSETIEETAELVGARGGTGIAVRCDHSDPEQVRALVERIHADHGRLDLLVNDVWGGDQLAQWDKPLWEHDLAGGLRLLHRAVDTHIITSHFALPLMIAQGGGLVVEITDGTERWVDELLGGYRGSFFYDLAKHAVIRLARNQAAELRPHGVAAVALTPGFLRSEAMLDHFGVTEENWRAGADKDPHFAASETPAYIGRAVAALAADPEIMAKSGGSYSTGELAAEYGFTDLDGSRPDFLTYYREFLGRNS
ncbi:NAD(P)-dependent dehydrogenase (short-subunit alcohol dehydrogenase family) [Streptosporangium becharense]|uniref:NAD(P)-dependent dehydrogenase (Short-subunit alcohol dehydrogenase family) n=1 Tax=Streptosporangium becharense TaxID=1816182 RepID=A0A7W9MGH5_9ACTN|nr:SDR family oxidoreductase [Streptosporangium becharense]MBB2908875.1 NAD(P)-dependent dehydrogenase (short-subunit alcohol dehydrogenase family) [Streptosporangium becharense]MBB5820107.1 NAD(P)-dependent dehydrogenase (short-subunit alcohol dehydrogenase family) [Streptosporangium becharense]